MHQPVLLLRHKYRLSSHAAYSDINKTVGFSSFVVQYKRMSVAACSGAGVQAWERKQLALSASPCLKQIHQDTCYTKILLNESS